MLYLISAMLLIGMYVFDLSDSVDRDLKEGLVRMTFGATNVFAAYVFRDTVPEPSSGDSVVAGNDISDEEL